MLQMGQKAGTPPEGWMQGCSFLHLGQEMMNFPLTTAQGYHWCGAEWSGGQWLGQCRKQGLDWATCLLSEPSHCQLTRAAIPSIRLSSMRLVASQPGVWHAWVRGKVDGGNCKSPQQGKEESGERKTREKVVKLRMSLQTKNLKDMKKPIFYS